MDPISPSLHDFLISSDNPFVCVENDVKSLNTMTEMDERPFAFLEDGKSKHRMEHRPYTCPPEEVCGCEHLLLQCLECGSEKRGTVDVEKLFCDMGGGKIECGMSDIEEMPLDYSVNEKERQESIKIGLNSLKPSKKENVNYVNDSKNKLRDTDAEKIDIDHTKSRKCQNKTTNMEKTLFKCLNASNEKTPAVQAPCLLENRKEKLTGKTSEQIPLEVEEIHLKFSKDSHLQVQLYNSEQTPMDDLKDKSIINYVPCELQQSPAECSEIPLEDKSKQEQQEFTDAVTKDIKCSTCGEEINGLTYSSENMKDPFKCFMCLKEVVQANEHTTLIRMGKKYHMVFNAGEKPFKCYQCKEDFRYMADLKEHLILHTQERPFQCDVCGKTFRFRSMMKRHMLFHSDEKPFQCALCGKEFKIIGHLNQHMTIHTGKKPVECSICGEEFKQRRLLKHHMLTHNEEKPYSCSLCEKEFKYNCDLKEHMFTHLGDNPFKCSVCGKEFNRKSNLQQHRVTHSRETPYKCPVCGKEFTLNGNLKQHMATHIDEKLFKCLDCGKEFNRKSNLDQHRAVHNGDTPYKCLECGKVFKLKGHLRKHMITHNDDKAFECPGCGKQFRFKGDLKRHIKSVVGNKPVECSECGKRMKCKGELKQHMFTHTREKYECTQCGKQYTQKGTLNRHKLSHVCGKSYKCSKCAKEFTRKSNLEQHMFSHVREDSEEFEYLVNKNTLKQDSTILYINEDSSTDIKTPQEYNFMKHVITIKTEAETDSDCSNFNTESADGSTFTDDDDKKCHSVNNSIEYVNNKGGTEIFIKEEVHLG
ncbi:zinc finger protein 665-like [Homarus americanus]|uniref:zinc finger protein 665-like n=1 Tax=Homarus americanus TaxID=6706 RepID=UPI001C47215D|nr:zinc finger protein 665-like [Homarus americanus]XP_042234683.1 zinc finger protein 665-like [Homarus americanus]XP_042234684.1 zinc finger protein 665-like [Homarus americanus]